MGRDGVLDFRQINTCRKVVPLQVKIFRRRHFAMSSMSLIFLRLRLLLTTMLVSVTRLFYMVAGKTYVLATKYLQSSVWRLPNYWPPTPSPPSECVLPPHQSCALAGRWGGGGSIFRKTPDIGLASYIIIPLRIKQKIVTSKTYLRIELFLVTQEMKRSGRTRMLCPSQYGELRDETCYHFCVRLWAVAYWSAAPALGLRIYMRWWDNIV